MGFSTLFFLGWLTLVSCSSQPPLVDTAESYGSLGSINEKIMFGSKNHASTAWEDLSFQHVSRKRDSRPQLEKRAPTMSTIARSVNPTWILPKPPKTSCPTMWADISSTFVLGPRTGNYAQLDRVTGFVTRKTNSASLLLNGAAYRISGVNIFWLGLDQSWKNDVENVEYPSQNRVQEAIAIAAAMGSNTIRAHTLGVSVGHALSVWPTAGQINENAFVVIDYAIYVARAYGLRLIIPLTDNWQYYHGGKYTFINWAGLSATEANQNLFYTSTPVIELFEQYISVILNRVNTFTGVRYSEDPTILAWETGNELGGHDLKSYAPPKAWTTRIAQYINKLAPKQLVADGTNGLFDNSGVVRNSGLKVKEIDIISTHHYPLSVTLWQSELEKLKLYDAKNFLLGEFDWTGSYSSLSNTMTQVQNTADAGALVWSVVGHDDVCCEWKVHNDGFTLHYPNGNTGTLQDNALLLTQVLHRLRGATPPSTLASVACPQYPVTY